ncbi:hypothetical protein DP107_03150 [Haloglomus irregulare]|uniref:Uncharacterized protein n=1 Tax=Haloglomus irregulare TaxID=2234134 RepID=A0A554NFK8_9EURY|nr:hypothetical protein DP107_03150 [Haloglomus irregulare]
MVVVNVERLRMHFVQALTRTRDADVRRHVAAALAELSPSGKPPLITCPRCGAVGLPERISDHDCTEES